MVCSMSRPSAISMLHFPFPLTRFDSRSYFWLIGLILLLLLVFLRFRLEQAAVGAWGDVSQGLFPDSRQH